MTDLRKTIAPKSDQLNSDDLIGTTKTITVTKVSLCTEPDQPIAISFEGDNGKPYKPCKSMRRVLVNVWGPDGNEYTGRRMTLFRDDKVMFGGLAVGGIRISHVSHITEPVTMALTATRANRKPFTVQPLSAGAQSKTRSYSDYLDEKLAGCSTQEEVADLVGNDPHIKQRIGRPETKERIDARMRELPPPPPEDDFEPDYAEASAP